MFDISISLKRMAFALCFAVVTMNAQKKLNFDEGWKFHFGNAANPAEDFNYSTATIFSKSGGAANTAIDPKFDDSKWTTLNLPHDWAVALPFENSKSFDV